jgi:competence protein ComEC
MENQTKTLLKFLILPLFLLMMVVLIALGQSKPNFKLQLHFYESGGALIQTYSGRKIVIDGASSDAMLQDLGKELPFYDRSIDLIVSTSTKDDQVAGLLEIAKRYKVKSAVLSDESADSGLYQELVETLDQKRIQKIYAKPGQRVWIDSATTLDLFNATDSRLSFGQTHILFLNSFEGNVLPFTIDSQLVKIGYDIASAEFLEQVAPAYAVLQVNEKTYNTKFSDLIANLHTAGVEIYRTDQDRDINFVSDGLSLAKK